MNQDELPKAKLKRVSLLYYICIVSLGMPICLCCHAVSFMLRLLCSFPQAMFAS